MSASTTTEKASLKDKAKSLLPTGKELLDGGKDLGMIAVGMIGAHSVIVATKKDNAIVAGCITVAGFGIAVASKNPLLKMFGLGMSAYGTIKLFNHGVKQIASPATTEGLNGILPEKAKEMIRKFIPTLSGMDEVAGVPSENLAGDYLDNLSLDDLDMRGAIGTTDEPNAMEGLGEVAKLAA